MKSQAQMPLVSVGIPTYNRPAGLRRTLECITRQTYPNVEIVVSDNASPNDDTKALVQEYIDRGCRIRYYRQDENIGVFRNFQYVLKQARGEFYMWAADDDEWDPSFISFCVENIGDSGSLMTSYCSKNRTTGESTVIRLPQLAGKARSREDLAAYIDELRPQMFYGLHRRRGLEFFLDMEAFDWQDCYFCLRLIWERGFRTRNDVCLYTAGIDARKYVPKSLRGGKLNPMRYFAKTLPYVVHTREARSAIKHLRFLVGTLRIHTLRGKSLDLSGAKK